MREDQQNQLRTPRQTNDTDRRAIALGIAGIQAAPAIAEVGSKMRPAREGPSMDAKGRETVRAATPSECEAQR